jgi:hypothetical protein
MDPDLVDRLAEHTCPVCEAHSLDAETLYVHLAVHAKEPGAWDDGLGCLPYSRMPSVGRLLHRFGVQLIDWMDQRAAEMDHGCLTGDCPHEMKEECLTRLLNDFLEDVNHKQ